MIKSIWNNLTSFLNGAGSATPVGRILISNTAAETSILQQMIDLARVQNVGELASIELEIITNGVAPLANQTVTAWYAFCSSGSKTPAELATAAASQVCALAQAANVRRRYMLPVVYMGAQYLYVWFDHTAIPAGATLEINLIVNAKTG